MITLVVDFVPFVLPSASSCSSTSSVLDGIARKYQTLLNFLRDRKIPNNFDASSIGIAVCYVR